MRSLLAILVASLLPVAAIAGKCELTVKRTACSGKEGKAVEPYKGKPEMNFKQIDGDKVASTTVTKDAKDAAACKKMADKEKDIVRKGTLSEKEVVAKFEGGESVTLKGTSSCD